MICMILCGIDSALTCTGFTLCKSTGTDSASSTWSVLMSGNWLYPLIEDTLVWSRLFQAKRYCTQPLCIPLFSFWYCHWERVYSGYRRVRREMWLKYSCQLFPTNGCPFRDHSPQIRARTVPKVLFSLRLDTESRTHCFLMYPSSSFTILSKC